MSSELLAAKLGEVNAEAAREEARVKYLIGVVEANEPALGEIYLTPDIEEADAPALLYAKVEEGLRWAEGESLRVVGVLLRYIPPDEIEARAAAHPLVRLGWARYLRALPLEDDQPTNKPFPYVLRPTDEAIALVNGLRDARGYEHVEEQAARARAAWHRVGDSDDSE